MTARGKVVGLVCFVSCICILFGATSAMAAPAMEPNVVCLCSVTDVRGAAVPDVSLSYLLKGGEVAQAIPQPDGTFIFKNVVGKVVLRVDESAAKAAEGAAPYFVDVFIPAKPRVSSVVIQLLDGKAVARVIPIPDAQEYAGQPEFMRSTSSVPLVPAGAGGCPAGGSGDDCTGPSVVGEGVFGGDTSDNTASGISDCGFNNLVDEWYCYTATCTGTATASTCNDASFDTTLAVFDACGGTEIACNDDGAGCAGWTSELSWAVTAGTSYFIRVSGFNNATGTYNLTIDCEGSGGGGGCPTPGDGDECDAPLIAADGVQAGDTTDNTGSTGDDTLCGYNDTIDEWWCYTATCDGTATADTCTASFDTTLAVFDACGGGELDCNDDTCGLQSEVSWAVTAGTSYFIRVSGFNGAVGTYGLTISCGGAGACTDFSVTAPGTWSDTTCGAGDDCALRSSEDHIYEVTLPNDGTWTFSLCGSSYDTYLFVGTSCCGSEIGSNDDSCGLQSEITANLTAGTYYVDVEGYSGCGAYTLNVFKQQACDVTCPGGATPENEPNCGLPTDTVNGGCNSSPPVFSPISCDETVCGTAAFDGATRDTDWYGITVASETIFTWTVEAEFAALIGMVETVPPGSGDCADGTGFIDPAAFPDPCVVGSVTTECMPAGTYWFFVAPLFGDLVTCGAEYVATLTCETPCTIPTGACCFADGSCAEVTEDDCSAQGGEYQGDGTDCASANCVAICGPGAGDCFDPGGNGTPGCEDPDCCTLICGLDSFCCDFFWDGICAGEALDYCEQPAEGGCCLPDGTCVVATEEDCDAQGGSYQGDGTDCSGLPAADATITVELLTDNYGSETTWEIVDQSTGAVIAEEGPFASATFFSFDVPVSSLGCYTFTIYDSYGDGICCAWGIGYYEVFYNGAPVGSGGDFGFEESITDIGGCDPNPPGPGACCLPDASCVVTTETCCNEASGAFQGADTDCGGLFAPEEASRQFPCNDHATGTLDGASPVWNRVWGGSVDLTCNSAVNDSSSDGQWYAAFQIQTSVAENLEAEVLAAGTTISDTTMTLYCDPFDPNQPLDNAVAYDDDGGAGFLSAFTAADGIFLPANTTYWLVLSTFSAGDSGDFDICLGGHFSVGGGGPGACCLPDGTCQEMEAGDCSAAGGTFGGGGTDCATFDCPDLVGACCQQDGTCLVTTETCCEFGGGTFLGGGTDCGGAAGDPTTYASGPLSIPIDSALPPATDTINVPDSFSVADVNVSIQLTHTWQADLEITIEHNGTPVLLMDDQCGSNNDMDVIFDDEGTPIACGTPTVGTAIPLEALAAFDTMDASGDWTISINDDAGGDTGTLDSWSLIIDGPGESPCLREAKLDIKPGSCPNSFNRQSNGVLPVALMSTDQVDVTQVDLSTVRISRADGVGGEVAPHEGPPGPHSVFDDVATPFDGPWCFCHTFTGDGIVDLSMKFKTRDTVDALELDDLPPGALVELVVTGSLLDGTEFFASDCIRLVPPGTPPGMLYVQEGASGAGAWVELTPIDEQMDGGGWPTLNRSYPQGSQVTLTADDPFGNRPFVRWVLDGVPQPQGDVNLVVTVGVEPTTARAIYRRPFGNVNPKGDDLVPIDPIEQVE